MFLGYYELEDREKFNIYHYKNSNKYRVNEWGKWLNDTFSPNIKNIRFLDFKISGKTYKEKQECLKEIALNWQLDFSYLGWSYGELAEVMDYFYNNAKKYGLVKEFKENAII